MTSLLALPTARIDLERRWIEPADGVAERLTTLEARVLQVLAASTTPASRAPSRAGRTTARGSPSC